LTLCVDLLLISISIFVLVRTVAVNVLSAPTHQPTIGHISVH